MSVCIYSVFVLFLRLDSGLEKGYSPVQEVLLTVYKKNNGFIPEANYTDRATAAFREVSANYRG
jgi:hypothetical protein